MFQNQETRKKNSRIHLPEFLYTCRNEFKKNKWKKQQPVVVDWKNVWNSCSVNQAKQKKTSIYLLSVCVCCMCIAYLFQDQKKNFFMVIQHTTHTLIYLENMMMMWTLWGQERMNKKKNKKKSRNSSTSSSSMDSVCRTFKLLLSHTHSHKFNSLNCIDEEKKIESNSLILHMVKKKTTYHIWCREKKPFCTSAYGFFSLSLCVLFVIIFIIIVVELGDHPYESFHLDGFRGQSRC